MQISCNTKKVLGMGSIAKVYEGVWCKQTVAVKRVLLHDERTCSCNRENILRKLDHPNVIKLLSIESDYNFRYYAMELCEASLDKLFLNDEDPEKYRGPMPSNENVLHQLAVGLEYIHMNGLIHGNIKPSNVLIWVDSRTRDIKKQVLMKWADFDLDSKHYKKKDTRAFEWLAPESLEILRNEETKESEATSSRPKVTAESDAFALGLLFGYFLLNGRHLYGSVSWDIVINMVDQNPVNLKEVKPKYAVDLIQKMLADKPKERKTLSEVIKEIRQAYLTTMDKDAYSSRNYMPPRPPDYVEESTNSSTGIKQMAKMFLDIRIEEKQKQFYFLCAAETYPSLEEIKRLIGEGVNVNCINNRELTPLHQLAQKKTNVEDNLLGIFRLLIENGAEINYKDKRGNNVLLLLCQNYRGNNLYKLIHLLVNHKIETTCKAENGWDALLLLCENYQDDDLIDIIQLLIPNGIEVRSSKNDIGNNALLLVCQHYRNKKLIEVVKLFIQLGVEANYKNTFEWNALHFLCQNDQTTTDVIEMLIHNGIEINSKTSSGENALFYLLQNYMENSLLDKIVRFLIRHGIQFHCEHRVKQYYEMLQKRGMEDRNGGLEILKYMAKEDLTLGWHSDCKSCEDIMSIEDTPRKYLQHHHMFGNTRITFQLVLEDLKKSDKSLDVRNPTEWLLQKSREQITTQDSKDFETMATLSEQVKRGGNSTNFTCDQYEHYLRCLHRMARKYGAEKSMKQIEFFYLLPFDYPSLPDPREKANDSIQKIWAITKEWDKTLYNWMHKKGDEDFGKSMKEDAKRFLSALRNVNLNCHK